MKKLNNKGYLLVEIIVAIVLALGIGYFLMNLTIKFSREDEDIYQSIYWTNDKNVLTNTIMKDVEQYTLTNIEKISNGAIFTYVDTDGSEFEKELGVVTVGDTKKIEYGEFEKEIDESLEVGNIDIQVLEKYSYVMISMFSMYSDEDYGIKIFIPYSVGTDS